jgi:peptide/nickel transport system substrate-binding protein
MKTKVFWVMLSFIIALSLVSSSCAQHAATPTATAPAPTATAPAPTTTNWWDKFGEPKYGGEITTVKDTIVTIFDPFAGGYPGWQPWLEGLFKWDWALDRNVWSFSYHFVPYEYHKGNLAESWEFSPDLKSMIVHIRKGVKWQDKAPVNGREFTAHDVQYHYDRILGTGSGFTEPSNFAAWINTIEKVTAKDDYTVEIKFKQVGFSGVWQLIDMVTVNFFVPHEWVEQGDLTNWQNVVGTGPWILTNFVSDSSMTVSRNKNYWGYDERHPQNQLPYADKLTALAIKDVATKMAALRTGKIDILANLDWQHANVLKESNPELQVVKGPESGSLGLEMRVDNAPFTDIRVRKALQLALDLNQIAKTHYNGLVDGIAAGIVPQEIKLYCYPYAEWSQELKDEYSYNPTKAKQLLVEAGYPNGFKTNVVTSAIFDLDLMQIMKSYFSDIGVDMEIKTVDVSSYFQYIAMLKHDQMATAGTAPSNPQKLIQNYFSKTKGGGNFCNVNDEDYDALVYKFNNATTMDEAAKCVQQADKYVLEKHWHVVTVPKPTFIVCQPYLKGYSGEVIQESWNDWFHLTRIWIDQDLKKSMGR